MFDLGPSSWDDYDRTTMSEGGMIVSREVKSVELTPESLASYDCVLVSTHHSAYDWQQIADHAKLVVDTRNALGSVKGPRDHIIPA